MNESTFVEIPGINPYDKETSWKQEATLLIWEILTYGDPEMHSSIVIVTASATKELYQTHKKEEEEKGKKKIAFNLSLTNRKWVRGHLV